MIDFTYYVSQVFSGCREFLQELNDETEKTPDVFYPLWNLHHERNAGPHVSS